ncbi:glycoside hydrolase family 93 protein [Umbelopsis sp. PMI_123]|nr:glycoside hydrolase family 93 protein [Umbelopsis sp. PMI_123]
MLIRSNREAKRTNFNMTRIAVVSHITTPVRWIYFGVILAMLLAMVGYTSAAGTNLSMVGSPTPMSPSGGTYARSTRLSSGELLGIYTHSTGTNKTVVVCESTNNANSWTDVGTVMTGYGDIGNGFLLELPSGRILAAFRNHSENSKGDITYFRITVCYSDDKGRTWKYLSEPEGRPPPNGIWEPFMRLAHNGDVQIYYARVNANNDQDIVQRVSTNGGKTWSNFTTTAGATTTGRDGMPGVTEFDTGTGKQLLAIFETTEDGPHTGPFRVKSVTSSDDGNSWGNRNTVYIPQGTNNNAGSPQVATMDNNVLVAIFMTDEDTSLHNWTQGASAKALVSTDGVHWSNKITVSPVQTSWPGIIPLDTNHLLTLFDHQGVHTQAMLLS